MAEVYRAWDLKRNVPLAMKILLADLAEDKVFLRRFRREASTLARLEHPYIVRFYGLEQDDDLAFMMMDYVEGTTLRKEIFRAKGPLSRQRVLEIMQPVCSALHYAHQMGMVHCDVKPANIMIHNNGTVLVADFGISRMMESSTTTMVGAGTPAYMAPEQVRGEDPRPQTDIYGLGVVLYEMLTGGERPFTGETAQTTGSTSEKVRWEQLFLSPPSPRLHDPEISPALETVVLKCLEKRPDDRFDSTLTLLSALEQAIPEIAEAGSPTKVGQVPTPIPPTSFSPASPGSAVPPQAEAPTPYALRRKRRGRVVTWALLSIGVIVILAIWMMNSSGWINFPGQASLAFNQTRTAAVAVLPPPTSEITASAPPTQDSAAIDTAVALTLQAQLSQTPSSATPEPSTPTPSITTTPSPTIEPTPTPTTLALGGADRIAFVSDNDIWVANVDGSAPIQLTTDRSLKSDLQWAPDGQVINFIVGTCVWSVNIASSEQTMVTCFDADELNAYQIDPTGEWVAISLRFANSHRYDLFVVPYAKFLTLLPSNRSDLEALGKEGCASLAPYPPHSVKTTHWSVAGKSLASLIIGPEGQHEMLAMDVSKCEQFYQNYQEQYFDDPALKDYQSGRNKGLIASYGWNGRTLVISSSFTEGFGELWAYRSATDPGERIALLSKKWCCYRDPQFSPDGNLLYFAYLDLSDRKIKIYYINFNTIGSQAPTPLSLEGELFSDTTIEQKPYLALHPASQP